MAHQWRGVIREYADRLPVTEATKVITLGEGGTPLVHAQQLSELTGCAVYLKVEGMNPTGSFKDRGMTMAMTAAVDAGAKAVVCASTGNTSASAAAYATAAGPEVRRAGARGQDRHGQAQPGDRARRHAAAGGRQLRRLPRHRPQAGRVLPGVPGELGQPRPHRGPEDRRLRGRRRARRRPGLPRPAGRQRRQHHRVLEGLQGVLRAVRVRHAGTLPAVSTKTPVMWGFQAAGAAPVRRRPPDHGTGHHRHGHPDRQPGLLGRAPSPPATSPAASSTP